MASMLLVYRSPSGTVSSGSPGGGGIMIRETNTAPSTLITDAISTCPSAPGTTSRSTLA
jgi:hypothetical protein